MHKFLTYERKAYKHEAECLKIFVSGVLVTRSTTDDNVNRVRVLNKTGLLMMAATL